MSEQKVNINVRSNSDLLASSCSQCVVLCTPSQSCLTVLSQMSNSLVYYVFYIISRTCSRTSLIENKDKKFRWFNYRWSHIRRSIVSIFFLYILTSHSSKFHQTVSCLLNSQMNYLKVIKTWCKNSHTHYYNNKHTKTIYSQE